MNQACLVEQESLKRKRTHRLVYVPNSTEFAIFRNFEGLLLQKVIFAELKAIVDLGMLKRADGAVTVELSQVSVSPVPLSPTPEPIVSTTGKGQRGQGGKSFKAKGLPAQQAPERFVSSTSLIVISVILVFFVVFAKIICFLVNILAIILLIPSLMLYVYYKI